MEGGETEIKFLLERFSLSIIMQIRNAKKKSKFSSLEWLSLHANNQNDGAL